MIVKLPNGKTAEFPDSMSPSQIETVLKNQFPSGNQKKVKSFSAPVPTEGFVPGFLQGVDNAVIGAIDLLPGVNIPKQNYSSRDASTQIGQFVGGVAPFAMIPEIAGGPYANAAIQGSLGAAALGSSDNKIKNALIGGALGPVAQGLGQAIPFAGNALLKGIGNKARNALSQGDRFLKLRTPEEVAAISANFPPNQKVNATDVFLENKINPVVKIAQDKSSNIINDILGETDDYNIYKKLKDAVSNNKDSIYKKYENIFENIKNRASSVAKDAGISRPVKLENYKLALSDVQKDNPEVIDLMSDNLKSLSKKFELAKNKNESFDMAHRIQSALGKAARNNPDEASYYSTLQNAVLDDIGDAHKSLDESLYKDYMEARNGYKREYVPYKDKSISNILKDKTNNEQIANKILSSTNSKILNDLSPSDRKLLLSHKLINHVKKLSSGEDINPVQFLKAYKGIKPNIKARISNNDIDNSFGELEQILKAYNPKTTSATGVPLPSSWAIQPLKETGSLALNSLLSNPAIRNAYARQSISYPRNALLGKIGQTARNLPASLYGERN